MKKTTVTKRVSDVRQSCEMVNRCLRSTANRYDFDVKGVRPSTPEERRVEVENAKRWVQIAWKQLQLASRDLDLWAAEDEQRHPL